MNIDDITVKDLDMRRVLRRIENLFERYRTRNFITGIEDQDAFARNIRDAVNRLDDPERLIIEERYMKSAYVPDFVVYLQKHDYPISKDTYSKRRNQAIFKLLFVFEALGHVSISELLKQQKEAHK